MQTAISRAEAEQQDRSDPLRDLRDEFLIADPHLLYMDGNSLGRLPHETLKTLTHFIEQEWGGRLVAGWDDWIDLPSVVGDKMAVSLLGAKPGEVVVSDSTSVNLFKLALAALDRRPGAILTDTDNFPTDRYVLEGVAKLKGVELRWIQPDGVHGVTPDQVAAAMDDEVSLVTFSHVGYRTGAMADMEAITSVAHQHNALTLWDLSHSVGSVPVELNAWDADLAVGCSYKYVNGGPGGPAFLFVSSRLIEEIVQPIWGWFGQTDQFKMGPGYEPLPDIRRFLVGTPPLISLKAVEAGVDVLARAGIENLRSKSIRLTQMMIGLYDGWLAGLGVGLGSPRDPSMRGSHLAFTHPDAEQICGRLIADHGVVPDFREPNVVRFGVAPVYTTFTEAWDAMDRFRQLLLS